MDTTAEIQCWFSLDISGNWWFVWIGENFIEKQELIGKNSRLNSLANIK